MSTLTFLQLIGVFSVYAVMTMLLPAILLYRKISSRGFAVRFMIYQATGNFYMITLVMILQFLHISNGYTLVLFTVVTFFAAFAFLHERNPQQDLQVFLEDLQKLMEGKYGLRLFLNRIFVRVCKAVRRFVITEWKHFCSGLSDVLLVAGVVAAVMAVYGVNAFVQYGYCASDIVVHNYWINYMSRGQMFVAGVYPFGFHCVIYYLHTVFSIDTYVLLRLFWVVQTLVIHLMLLAFIRICCKTRYIAYAGLGVYLLAGRLLRMYCYLRYTSSLPQEFGMIFILPCAAFLFLFFEKRKEELAAGNENGQDRRKKENPVQAKKLKKEKKINKAKKSDKKLNKISKENKQNRKKEKKHLKKTKWKEGRKQEKTAKLKENTKTMPASAAQSWDEERIYLLDDVLAESAAREAALCAEAEKKHISVEEMRQQEAEEEAILVIEENPQDGSLYIKEVPLARDTEQPEALSQDLSEPRFLQERQNRKEEETDCFSGEEKTEPDRFAQSSGVTAPEQKKEHRLRKRFADALKREYETESTWYLFFFLLNLSLTLTVHFYNTIIAGLLCMGVAGGYCFRLFRRKYFGRVVAAGIMAIGIAVLPMFLAYLGGTPLEGSLRWAMSIINGTKDQPVQIQATDEKEEEEKFSITDIKGYTVLSKDRAVIGGKVVSRNAKLEGGKVDSVGDVLVENHLIKGGQMVSDAKLTENGKIIYEGPLVAIGYDLPEAPADGSGASVGEKRNLFMDRFKSMMQKIGRNIYNTISEYLFNEGFPLLCILTPCSVILLFVLAVLFFIMQQTDYAARMMSVSVYMGIMTLVFSAAMFGLPELMDARERTCIYYAYSLIALWCLCADGLLQITLGWMKNTLVPQIASFVPLPVLAAYVLLAEPGEEMWYTKAMQSNDAVICLTNIIKDNKDNTWTIVSANDELRMGEDHGFHYELDTFLREMELRGGGSTIRIPTKKVYFFIERKPIDYSQAYDNSGQRISRKGAARPLPFRSGISMYKGRNRWIEMSRIAYWAQMFKSIYPHEVEVYYETTDFICYCVNQNEYSLFNFSVNYLYNMMDYSDFTEEEADQEVNDTKKEEDQEADKSADKTDSKKTKKK